MSEGTVGAGCTVLVVEDDADIAETLASVIAERGYRVVLAGNGAQALDRLRTEPRPAIILLDLRMPVMDGRQFRREQLARPELAPIPVVLLTADTRALSVPEMAGVARLVKPIDLARLVETIESHCRPPVPPVTGRQGAG